MDEREITTTKSSETTKPNPFAKYLESPTSTSKSTTTHTFPSTPSFNDNDDNIFTIDCEPISSSSTIPPSHPSIRQKPQAEVLSLASSLPVGSPICHDLNHLDLVAARSDFECCITAKEKAEFRARLKPLIVKRLRELSQMEAKHHVGNEIADTVDFLKVLYSSNPILEELGNISDKSRQGVIKLLEGKLLVKEAQGQLQSAVNNLLFSNE